MASPRYALENVCYQLNKHVLVLQSQYILFSIYKYVYPFTAFLFLRNKQTHKPPNIISGISTVMTSHISYKMKKAWVAVIGGVWDRTLVVIVFRFVPANESIFIFINHGPTLTHLQREKRMNEYGRTQWSGQLNLI